MSLAVKSFTGVPAPTELGGAEQQIDLLRFGEQVPGSPRPKTQEYTLIGW